MLHCLAIFAKIHGLLSKEINKKIVNCIKSNHDITYYPTPKLDHQKVKKIMKKIKIIIGISLLLLLIGSASAAIDTNNLKQLPDYNKFQDGCSTYTTNDNRFISVEKLYGDNYKNDLFTNSSDLLITNAGDNIYYFEDSSVEYYGYQEIINSDGTNYLVSINQKSKLSPSEKTGFLNDIKEFNKLNNLEPIEI